jgi:alkyldihydroxyacetonephosphate synthase
MSKRVCRRDVFLGRVHVAAGPVVKMVEETVTEACESVQQHQINQTVMSYFHVKSLAAIVELDFALVCEAVEHLGCKQWPTGMITTVSAPATPDLCTSMLQCGHILAPLVFAELPRWASWLDRHCSGGLDPVPASPPSVKTLQNHLTILFKAADYHVDKSNSSLKLIGFDKPSPNHIVQSIPLDAVPVVPSILLVAAAQAITSSYSKAGCITSKNHASTNTCPPEAGLCLDSSERLGRWGFYDTCFVARVDTSGSPFVTMQGNRYGLAGRKLCKVIPFIERETGIPLDLAEEAASFCPDTYDVPRSALDRDGFHIIMSCVACVSTSDVDRVRHGFGHAQEDVFAIRTGKFSRVPDVVVWPTTEAEVSSLVTMAGSRNWNIIPFGGGTNVSSATRCPSMDEDPRPIISLDMKKLDSINWINEENGLVCVAAGITGRALVEKLGRLGYTIGHEPDSIEFSTLGGWIATKASGMKRNKYGNIEDIVKNFRVIGANGKVVQHGHLSDGHAVWGRESCGPSFSSLIIGSEGCLGIITSAVLRVWPLPEVKEYDSIAFSTMDSGLQFVREVSRLGSRSPASCRLLDNAHFRLGQALRPEENWSVAAVFRAVSMSSRLLRSWLMSSSSFDHDHVVCATIVYEGSREHVQQEKREVCRLSQAHNGIHLGSDLGRTGYNLTFLIAYLRDFALNYYILGESFETFAPWSRVSVVIQETKATIHREYAKRMLPGKPFVGCRVTQLYHEGACLYFYLCFNVRDVGGNHRLGAGQKILNGSEVFSDIEHEARETILKFGGSLSHHHGVGKIRSSFVTRDEISSPTMVESLRAYKIALDPRNVFGARNGVFADGSIAQPVKDVATPIK